MSLIKGTHHIALRCTDKAKLREMEHFYCDLLGLKAIRHWEGGTGFFLWTGNSILEINVNESFPDQGSVHHFALLTDDVDECVRIVREAGYEITREPQNITIPHVEAPMPIRMAFCKGPVGEDVEFFTEL